MAWLNENVRHSQKDTGACTCVYVSLCVNLFFSINIIMTTIKISRHNPCIKEAALNIQMSLT